jgi:uncharacterized protein (UPF0276 family)
MKKNTTEVRPFLGFGLGLRPDHYTTILEKKPDIDWFEVLSENYMVPGGKPLYYLDKIREHYPVVMHGVSLSIGSCDQLDWDYLKQLKALAKHIEPEWISDHFCWTGFKGINMHDLLPLPYTQEAIDHVVSRVQQVQEFLGRRILLENASSYVTYSQSMMTEWEFVKEVIERADCLLLLDINNIYVSGFNHDFDPKAYIDAIPADRVWQHHLAGHTHNGNHIIDTHDHPVIDPVWDLYAYAVKKFGPVSVMIERDDNIPPFEELYKEFDHMKRVFKAVQEMTAE